MQTSIGTMRCARSHVQLHATTYPSIAVNKLCLPDASQPRLYESARLACATACNIMSQHCCE